MELILLLMKRPINKPPLKKRTIKQQYIKTAMIVTSLSNFFRPTVRKKPNLIIVHSGTNDIQNNVNTLQRIRKVISSIKEYDTDDNIKIALSSIIHRSDHDFEDKINENNRKGRV